MLYAENTALAVIPEAIAVDAIPVPGAHVACGQSEGAALLALQQTAGRSLEFRGARRNALFQLGVELLQLSGLPVELGEHLNLRAQHLWNNGHRNVVHCAHLVAAQPVHVRQMDRGDEDHRRLLEPRMLADHCRELEPVEIRHADVDQDDGDLGLEQIFERLATGRGLDQVLAELTQDHLIAREAFRPGRRPAEC